MQGSFGWTACNASSGTISYAEDESDSYVKVTGNGSCHETTCMSNWVSVPTENTMAHPAFKFDYRAEGYSYGYDLIIQDNTGAFQITRYNSSTWQSVTECMPTSLQGRAEAIRFYRGSCSSGNPDWIQVKNARLEDDATSCP